MALKSTIYKVSLQLSDFDRDYYHTFSHNVALHPSETIERMLVRLLAFSVYASEDLSFTKGLSTDDEPDLWQKSLTGEIDLWIDLGLPDLKRIRRAAGKSKKVAIFTYGGQKVAPWFDGIVKDLRKIEGLSVYRVDMTEIETLADYVERSMELSIIIQDGAISITLGDCYAEVGLERLYE